MGNVGTPSIIINAFVYFLKHVGKAFHTLTFQWKNIKALKQLVYAKRLQSTHELSLNCQILNDLINCFSSSARWI